MYFLIVADSFGIGADEKAWEYGDTGSNTIMSAGESEPGLRWPFLERMGLGNASELVSGKSPYSCRPVTNPIASYGAMRKISRGKDTQTGHWEIAGILSDTELKLMPPEYPSFDEETMDALRKSTGTDFIGNYSESGTVIIEKYYDEHIRTGYPIIYTSADSVMQIAAHESVLTKEELYDICLKARKICDTRGIGRVIARPFAGEKGSLYRTKYRRDFSIELPAESYFTTEFPKLGIETVGVGKIGDLFNDVGIVKAYHDKGNDACLARCTQLVARNFEGTEYKENMFVFINLVDTDSEYGHRRNPVGYGREIARISEYLEGFTGLMKEGDVLYFTADHGCDPCFKGTDHTREFVPLLMYEKRRETVPVTKTGECLGIVDGFDWCVKNICERERKKQNA